jgi:hypothetical protein
MSAMKCESKIDATAISGDLSQSVFLRLRTRVSSTPMCLSAHDDRSPEFQQLESARKSMSWCWFSEVGKVGFVSCESFLPQVPVREAFLAKLSHCVLLVVLSTHILLSSIDTICSTIQLVYQPRHLFEPNDQQA